MALALGAGGTTDGPTRGKRYDDGKLSRGVMARSGSGGRGARGDLLARDHRIRRELAPVMRCRGADASQVRCGLMRCASQQHDALHNGSACSRDARCSQYYRTTFANWTFCIAVGSRGVRRTALLDEGDVDAHPLASAAVCATTTADILARCETGFVKAAP